MLKLPGRAQSFDFCSQIVNKLLRRFIGHYVQNDRNAIERCARSRGPKKLTKTYKKGV